MRQRPEMDAAGLGGPKFGFVGAVIFTIIAVGGWVYFNRDNIREYMQTQEKREASRQSIEQTKDRNALMKHQHQSLALNGIESVRQVRERLHYRLPGEKVVYFTYEDAPTTVTKKAESTEKSAGEQQNQKL